MVTRLRVESFPVQSPLHWDPKAKPIRMVLPGAGEGRSSSGPSKATSSTWEDAGVGCTHVRKTSGVPLGKMNRVEA